MIWFSFGVTNSSRTSRVTCFLFVAFDIFNLLYNFYGEIAVLLLHSVDFNQTPRPEKHAIS